LQGSLVHGVASRGSYCAWVLRTYSFTSATADFAVRAAPMMVAEANPVQSPYPSKCSLGTSMLRVPSVIGCPFSLVNSSPLRWLRCGLKPVHQMMASQLYSLPSAHETPAEVNRSNIGEAFRSPRSRAARTGGTMTISPSPDTP